MAEWMKKVRIQWIETKQKFVSLSHKRSLNVGRPGLSWLLDYHQGPNYFYFLFYSIFMCLRV